MADGPSKMGDRTEQFFRSIGSGTKTIQLRPATPPPNVTHVVGTFGSSTGIKSEKRVRFQSPLFSRSSTVESANRADTFVIPQPIDFLQTIEESPQASLPMAGGPVGGQSSQSESFVLYDSTGPHNPLFAPLLTSTMKPAVLPMERAALVETSETSTKIGRASGEQAALDQTYVVETPVIWPSPLVDYSSMIDSTSTVLADKTIEEICEELSEAQKQTAELIARAKSRQSPQVRARMDETCVVNTPATPVRPKVEPNSTFFATPTPHDSDLDIKQWVLEYSARTLTCFARSAADRSRRLALDLTTTPLTHRTFGDTTKRTGDLPTVCPVPLDVPLDAEIVQWAREPFVSPFDGHQKKWEALSADALFDPNDVRNEDPDWERAQKIVVRVINEFEGNVEVARSHIIRLHSEHAERVRPARERMDALAAQLRQLEQKYADWHAVHDFLVQRIRRQKDEEVAAFLAETKSRMADAVAKLEKNVPR
ncbi:hypothetical protein M3Y99_01410100 [Aphelenchoides fujianensis]|nr:hypothetical protein M3Y99_01410100 [Aphelenchoides fujianensis]